MNNLKEDAETAFLLAVKKELARARAKFPGRDLTSIALMEEVGELAKATLDEDQKAVFSEAVQVATMAARSWLDGDSSTDERRARQGLPLIGNAKGQPRIVDASYQSVSPQWSRSRWRLLRWQFAALAIMVAISFFGGYSEKLNSAVWVLLKIGAVALVIGFVAYIVYLVWFVKQCVHHNVSLLQSTAWDMIRLMENDPRHVPKDEIVGRTEHFQRFIVAATGELIEKAKPLPTPPMPTPQMMPVPMHMPLPTAAMPNTIVPFDPQGYMDRAADLRDRNEATKKKFWFKAQGLRNGAIALLQIIEAENPAGARHMMIRHMERQLSDSDRVSHNFTEMKLLLGLPTEWPTEKMIKQVKSEELDFVRRLLLVEAARKRESIFKGLVYKAWPADKSEERVARSTPNDILEGMREYTR